jgi:NAD(P)-dependent dehydrogenase (short-subunit alcohol dehydrogenase family)
MTLPLTNKTALVTGGSRSIGAAIVKKLSDDGAAVAFTYADSVEKANELVRRVGGQASYHVWRSISLNHGRSRPGRHTKQF